MGSSEQDTPGLRPEMRADEATRCILRKLHRAMQANEPGTRQGLDPEALHDFRVAVRRTRSCLGRIEGVFPPRTTERFQDEFSWLGGVSGPTRDLDVYLQEIDDYGAGLPKDVREKLAPMVEALRRDREIEQRRLAEILVSDRYRGLMQEWQAFLDRPVPEETSLPHASRPVLEVATERIALCHERVLERGRRIDDRSPARKLHKLRIHCKRLRYLLEFFRELFDGAETGEMIRSLKRLQDVLGTFNDLQVHQAALESLAKRMVADDGAPVETILAMGRLSERFEILQGRQRRRFENRFAGFDSPRFENRFVPSAPPSAV